jgi:hypothetical protein
MGSFELWRRWLLVVVTLLLLGGLAMVALPWVMSPEAVSQDPVVRPFFGGAPLSAEARGFHRWAFGVWGSTLAGWGACLVFLVRHPLRRRERWAWSAVMTGLLIWFPLDTFVSFHLRVHFNVGLNVVVLLLALIPLLLMRRHLAPDPSA